MGTANIIQCTPGYGGRGIMIPDQISDNKCTCFKFIKGLITHFRGVFLLPMLHMLMQLSDLFSCVERL